MSDETLTLAVSVNSTVANETLVVANRRDCKTNEV